jgi:hypothetical protein
MLVWSVLTLAAGVCANASATSRAGTTIHRNALFMEVLRRFSPCGGLKSRLGFASASDSYVEPSGRSGSGLRTVEHPGETPPPYSLRIRSVCSKPLTLQREKRGEPNIDQNVPDVFPEREEIFGSGKKSVERTLCSFAQY